jgi:hypothetical protein
MFLSSEFVRGWVCGLVGGSDTISESFLHVFIFVSYD